MLKNPTTIHRLKKFTTPIMARPSAIKAISPNCKLRLSGNWSKVMSEIITVRPAKIAMSLKLPTGDVVTVPKLFSVKALLSTKIRTNVYNSAIVEEAPRCGLDGSGIHGLDAGDRLIQQRQ